MGVDPLLWFLIVLAVFSLIVGAVGRLLVPGPTPMGLLGTMGAGVAGAFIGGLVGRLLFGPRLTQGWIWVLSILGATLVVALVSRRRRSYGQRSGLLSDRAHGDPVVIHEVERPYRPGRGRRFL